MYSVPESVAASEKSNTNQDLLLVEYCNLVRKTASYVLVYRKHYFASRNQNFQYKRGIFFLQSKIEDTELQDSVAASEVSSWIS